ncbi:MAG: hypothetical protein ACE5KZ_16110 [Candidatus Scalinduaceae bacterium]
MLIADVCIQHDALGDVDDYFVITEAKAGAQALLDATRKYLENSGIQVCTELIPFVCGTRHNPNNIPLRVADSVNGIVSVGQQPFGVFDEIKADPEYVNALSTASTYMFQHAMMPSAEANTGSKESSSQPLTQLVSAEEFKTAIGLIALRTHASSVLFLGVAGTSFSSGKKAALVAGDFIVSMATGLATGAATYNSGTGYYVMFTPGHQIQGMLMTGALVDLKTGALEWSNAVRAGGDPIKPKVVANANTLNMLLRYLKYQDASKPPNAEETP